MPNNKTSFKKTPLSPEEKKIKEREFLSFDKTQENNVINNSKKKEKESIKTIYIRAPESYWNDIQEIVNLTGISMNAVCLELLRPAIKRKLKELKDEY